MLSPDVEVFREGTHRGYEFLQKPVKLCAVVSAAMPNCNPRLRDAPCDRPASEEAYHQLLTRKFDAVFEAALEAGADVLVIPDVGCGVYMNDPVAVGRALGQIAVRFNGWFREIHVVGSSDFRASAVEAASEHLHVYMDEAAVASVVDSPVVGTALPPPADRRDDVVTRCEPPSLPPPLAWRPPPLDDVGAPAPPSSPVALARPPPRPAGGGRATRTSAVREGAEGDRPPMLSSPFGDVTGSGQPGQAGSEPTGTPQSARTVSSEASACDLAGDPPTDSFPGTPPRGDSRPLGPPTPTLLWRCSIGEGGEARIVILQESPPTS